MKPNPDHKREFEMSALRLLYPGASAKRLKALWTLAKEKRVKIIDIPRESADLDGLMISLIRHEDTQYDTLLRHDLSRQDARGLIRPIIQKQLEAMKR